MKKYLFPAVILIVHLIFFINIKFTAWPEMLLWPYLMIKGWLPYKDIAIVHNPLLLADLTVFYKLFGLGLDQLKIYTWIIILLADYIAYYVASKLWGRKAALLTLFFMLPLTIFYEANGLWFDLGLSLFYPLIFYLSLKKKYFAAGFFWSLAFLTKQTAIWLLIPIAISAIIPAEKSGLNLKAINIKGAVKAGEKFLAPALAVLLVFILVLASFKILPDYAFWAFKFAGGSLPFAEGQIQLPVLRQVILAVFPVLVAFSADFLRNRSGNTYLFVWVFFASLGVYPRWELFHFLPAVPFMAFYLAAAFKDIELKKNRADLSAFIFAIIFLLLVSKKMLSGWGRETRFFEEDVIKTAGVIKENAQQNDRIFVLNSWEHFYFLTGTLPATKPWIPQFSWYLNIPNTQEKMLADLLLEKPEYIILHPYSETGLDSYRPEKLAEFAGKYYVTLVRNGAFEVLKRR